VSETRAALIGAALPVLEAAGVDEPARDARLLMRWASGLDGAGLAAAINEPAQSDEADRFRGAVARRAAREPVSHITGRRTFWGREFIVTADVLDPRPETETLVAEALHRGPVDRVLDLGTGSGCILHTLLAEWPQATGTGTDISEAALKIARANAVALGVADRVQFHCGDWLAGLAGPFDLVVSNPPYIAADEMAELAPEVRDHEPARALSPGGDGLDAYRPILAGVRRVMRPGAYLMLEIGPSQSDAVATLAALAGLNVVQIIPDLDHRARVVLAQS